jgi:hypothetical protein
MFLNWIVGPLIMLGLAWATLPDLPTYRTGVIMVGIARCIAMVLVWNQLAKGDGNYCAILVVVNSILQIILYSPYALLFINVIGGGSHSGLHVSYGNVAISVLIVGLACLNSIQGSHISEVLRHTSCGGHHNPIHSLVSHVQRIPGDTVYPPLLPTGTPRPPLYHSRNVRIPRSSHPTQSWTRVSRIRSHDIIFYNHVERGIWACIMAEPEGR